MEALETPKEKWLVEDLVERRQEQFGLLSRNTRDFTSNTEFISLGASCNAAMALETIGLKKKTYPFDWLRSPIDGLIHLLENNFEDFLTYTEMKHSTESKQKQQMIFLHARWGGSFWHHDIDETSVVQGFQRRVERLLAMSRDVPATRRRVFVRTVNSTREFEAVPCLMASLRRALPNCHVLLLLLVDLQSEDQLISVAELGQDVLVYRVDSGGLWRNPDTRKGFSMEKCCENYARGVAFACRHWAGSLLTIDVFELTTLKELGATVNHMFAGEPGHKTFWPVHFSGQRMLLGNAPQLPQLLK